MDRPALFLTRAGVVLLSVLGLLSACTSGETATDAGSTQANPTSTSVAVTEPFPLPTPTEVPTPVPTEVSTPVPTATSVPIPDKADPEDDRLIQVAGEIEANGFAFDPGAAGEVAQFVELVESVAGAANPWYFASLEGRPPNEFADRLRETVVPQGNVVLYWISGERNGIQTATAEIQNEFEEGLLADSPPWLTPAWMMREVASSLDPDVDRPGPDRQLEHLLRSFPGVEGEIVDELLVLSGSIDADDFRELEFAAGMVGVPVENRVVQIPTERPVDLTEVLAVELASYPDLTVELIGNIVVLTGSVSSNQERAEADRFARTLGFDVSNQLVVVEPAEPEFTLLELIDAQPELSTFRSLIVEADLVGLLTDPGELTVFVPTNDAFAAMGAVLDEERADADGLRALLHRHMIAGAIELQDGGSHVTLNVNRSIRVADQGSSFRINERAYVLVSASAANGTMHIVGNVIAG